VAASTGGAVASSKVLSIVGFLTLVSALLGAVVLYRTSRGKLLR
jgi:hypothetical protein